MAPAYVEVWQQVCEVVRLARLLRPQLPDRLRQTIAELMLAAGRHSGLGSRFIDGDRVSTPR